MIVIFEEELSMSTNFYWILVHFLNTFWTYSYHKNYWNYVVDKTNNNIVLCDSKLRSLLYSFYIFIVDFDTFET